MGCVHNKYFENVVSGMEITTIMIGSDEYLCEQENYPNEYTCSELKDIMENNTIPDEVIFVYCLKTIKNDTNIVTRKQIYTNTDIIYVRYYEGKCNLK